MTASSLSRHYHLGMRTRRRIGHTIAYVLVIVTLAYTLLPLFWMLSTSLKTEEQLRIVLPIQWIPNPATLRNYVWGWERLDWLRYLGNTLQWAGGTTLALLASVTLVAYAFARMKFRGREALMYLNIILMLLPSQMTMIPVFMLNAKLGWVGSWKPVLVPCLLAAAPHLVFLLRQFFRTIPMELSEAARIDGCGELGIFWHIILPLSKPVLALLVMSNVNWAWNDLLTALIYFKDENHRTLALAMQTFIGIRGEVGWGPMMAMATVWALPLVCLYYFSQHYFTEVFTLSGITG